MHLQCQCIGRLREVALVVAATVVGTVVVAMGVIEAAAKVALTQAEGNLRLQGPAQARQRSFAHAPSSSKTTVIPLHCVEW